MVIQECHTEWSKSDREGKNIIWHPYMNNLWWGQWWAPPRGLMPYSGLLHPEPLPLQQPTADLYHCRRPSNTVLAQALWVSGSRCTQGLFESSEHLWQVWGLILNAISSLLQSCWGFFFALECGVSGFVGIQHYPVNGHSAMCCFPTVNSTTGLPEFTQDWRRRLLTGTNQSLCTSGPRGWGSDPTRDWPGLARECAVEAWVGGWPAADLGAPSAALPAWGLLKKVAIIFITSTIVWPRVKQQGGNTAPPFNRKLD